ncbi:MAG: ABC transporter ATP-binding protein [Ignavibacteria bacterium GWA2_54_16]|nr:MAG: ABC transporter ATP-binding protein [Ignavibacteria bacterium GWA2_54_16]
MMNYGISKTISLPFESAVEKVTEELKKEGFGVLTTIDVKATMKQKLGVEFTKYVILGACNPPFAHQALLVEEQVGLLLPCNVIVYEKAGKTVISAFDPLVMTKILENDGMNQIAEEVRTRLARVIEAVH